MENKFLNQEIAQVKAASDLGIAKAPHVPVHVGSVKKVDKTSLTDMKKDFSTLADSLYLMTEDMKNNERSEFWYADGTPKIYKLLNRYVFGGGIVTSQMQTLLYDFCKEALRIKMSLCDNKENPHYLFADKNYHYALVMKAIIDKEDSYKICELLKQCNPSQRVQEMIKTVMDSCPDFELNSVEVEFLQRDDWFKKFMGQYKEVMIADGLSDSYSQAEFRLKALPILRNLLVENPEPYIQALNKVRSQADIIQALFTK